MLLTKWDIYWQWGRGNHHWYVYECGRNGVGRQTWVWSSSHHTPTHTQSFLTTWQL